MKSFSHLDSSGNPNMVDVSAKPPVRRTATARAIVHLPETVLEKLEGEDIQTKKGAVFQTAILAGIMAAKRTGELIPLCHPLGLENCQVKIRLDESRRVEITATAALTAKTGVEMEALTAAAVAALTVYDMCKGISQSIVIQEIRLLEKTKG